MYPVIIIQERRRFTTDFNIRENRNRNDRDPVFCSLAVIEENIQKKLTVKALADSIHLSRFHYQRLFREALGDSVMGYVTRRRLALAAADLAATDESILSIALKYGYDSHEGFTRSFRAHMGVSPKEYRKYHSSICSTKTGKEKKIMTYSKTTDEIIRNLNYLIVRTRNVAEYTRKNKEMAPEAAFYSEFWDVAAAGADAMANELGAVLERVTVISRHPDEISARFFILRAMETVGLKYGILDFQIRLLLSRAKPEHRAAFAPISNQYAELARNTRIKLSEIAEYLQELAALIFQDMRESGARKLQDAAAAGNSAAGKLLKASSLPCGYLAEEIREIAGELSSLALEKVSLSVLEDYLLRLDIVASAAELDLLRMPSHRQLLDGIPAFRERLEEAVLFFRELPTDAGRALSSDADRTFPADIDRRSAANAGQVLSADIGRIPAGQEQTKESASDQAAGIKRGDLILQSSILLFFLKGEIQKLGQAKLLGTAQRDALENICDEMNALTRPTRHGEGQPSTEKIAEILRRMYEKLTEQADQLGDCGTPLWFLAEEILPLAASERPTPTRTM